MMVQLKLNSLKGDIMKKIDSLLMKRAKMKRERKKGYVGSLFLSRKNEAFKDEMKRVIDTLKKNGCKYNVIKFGSLHSVQIAVYV
jgi:hypothetical protein